MEFSLKKKKKKQIKNWVKNGRTFKFKNYRMSIYKKLKENTKKTFA